MTKAPRDAAHFLKVQGALRTRSIPNKRKKLARKAKHK
jgi:hypothetical protein